MDAVIEELKNLFRKNGIPVFGIADSKLLENESNGHRPSDVLSAAASMICFGLPVPRGLLKRQNKLEKNYWRMAEIYYQKLDMIAAQVAVAIESAGQTALPVFS